MEILVTTNEAANILGLSVQGVHYRIKSKKLKSLKKDGKVFVYLDKELVKSNDQKEQKNETAIHDEVLKYKDEQISFLKKSIAWITRKIKKR